MSGMGMTIAPGAGAAGRQMGAPIRDTASGTVITAEIPAVPVGPSYGVLLPDGSVWYPGSRKRLPAPPILRVAVWVLAFAVLLAGAGDGVIRYHPSWVSALRHIVPAQSAPAASGGNGPPSSVVPNTTKGGSTAAAIALVTNPPSCLPTNTTAYTLNAPVYTVTVTAGASSAWVAGSADSNCQPINPPPQQQTLGPGQTLTIDQTSGAEFVHIGAGGTTIKVYHGLKMLATVPTPAHCPCYVLLQPAGH